MFKSLIGVNNGNRTEWSPIWSVIIQLSDKQNLTSVEPESDSSELDKPKSYWQ